MMLLLNSGKLVLWHRLLEELWDGAQPASAMSNLRTYATELRRVVFDGGPQLVSDPDGLRLQVDREQIDVDVFADLCARARNDQMNGDLPAASSAYERALHMWRGPALTGLRRGPILTATATALDERRIGVLEDWFDVRLDLTATDRCSGSALIADLRGHLAEHQVRERPHRQLMVTLYRLGDVAGALRACAGAREVLRRSLGLDPDDRVEWLQAAILRRDPDLLRPGVQNRTGDPLRL
ncbi:AfsR/SARP family transcriptional regulator [Microbispora bryophytorum]|nr:AfsR/SARP family transcriptional regulator [Microbispora bryophytorum]